LLLATEPHSVRQHFPVVYQLSITLVIPLSLTKKTARRGFARKVWFLCATSAYSVSLWLFS